MIKVELHIANERLCFTYGCFCRPLLGPALLNVFACACITSASTFQHALTPERPDPIVRVRFPIEP
jgi:hypothetical protein